MTIMTIVFLFIRALIIATGISVFSMLCFAMHFLKFVICCCRYKLLSVYYPVAAYYPYTSLAWIYTHLTSQRSNTSIDVTRVHS